MACLSFVHYIHTGMSPPPRTLFVDSEPVMRDGRYFLCTQISATHKNFVLAFTEEP